MKSKSFFLLLLGTALCATLHAQDTTAYTRLQAFVRNTQAFNHLYPQEKVYLHLDNTGYYLGERIWFSAYVVAASTLAPTNISRVLYVELLSAEGKVLETKKLKIENGRANGDFLLKPDDYFGGYYELRAYTRSMLNFDHVGVFSRVVPVYDKPKAEGGYMEKKMVQRNRLQTVDEVREKSPKQSTLNLTFYPEGGSLVAGLSSRVAFKATDKSGKSVEVKGAIYNEANENIGYFATLHSGMGFFELTPGKEKYTAVVEYDRKEYKFNLPVIAPQGYTLRVNNLHPQAIRVQVAKNQAALSSSVGVALICRGEAQWFQVLSVGEKSATLQIPKQDLPSGVAQLTLFGAGGEVYAERLLFIHGGEEQQVKITPTIHANYAPLSLIKVDFSLTNAKSKPVQATFSLSVYDAATAVPTSYSGNAMTHLLLTSDVKGYVENPTYYFEMADKARRLALDLLLMVQGWRRYEWKTVASGRPLEVKHWIEKGLLVDGAVLTDIRRKPMKDINVHMWLITDSLSQRGDCFTDEKGRFNFLLKDFYGVGEMSLMSQKDGKRERSHITLERNFELTPRAYSFYETHPTSSATPTAATDTLKSKRYTPNKDSSVARSYEMEEVKVSALQRWIGERNKATTIVYNMREENDKIKDKGGKDYGNFFQQLMLLGNLSCKEIWRNSASLDTSSTYWECNYNGKPVAWAVFSAGTFTPLNEGTADFIQKQNKASPPEELLADEVEWVMVDEVGYCERGVLNPKCYVVIYVIRRPKRLVDNKSIRNTPFQGFYKPAEFFNPNYGEYVLPDEKDFRRTLYWNPNVETDTEGKATVQLYNNSSCKEMEISAETVTESGAMGANSTESTR